MCGISLAAQFDGSLSEEAIQAGRRTTSFMARRGPDGEGHWVSNDRRIYLGHRRLSVIDLSERGGQPMHWKERGLHISYNGEIYNYRELRHTLQALGHRFVTESDTEVILHGYGEWGREVVKRLRGMFALALWDEKQDELFLARDPYGIKPLYYSSSGSTFRAASQVRALQASGAMDSRPDPAGWVGFLLFGYVPEPWTTDSDIRALPAGSWLCVTKEGVSEPVRFAGLSDAFTHKEPVENRHDLAGSVREALLDSVQAHLVSDVPVGAFLSAGVDSSVLVALMREAGCEDLRTVTLGFEEFRGKHEDEVPLAETLARHYGTQHTTRLINRREFKADWPRVLASMDQPSVDGANTWLVSKAAHAAGIKVVVSGVGGDELFGGYPGFRQIPRWVRMMQRMHAVPLLGNTGYGLARGATRLCKGLPPKLPAIFKYARTYEGAYFARRGLFMPWELPRLLDPDFAEEGLQSLSPLEYIGERRAGNSPLANVMTMESSLYMRNQLLRDADWASMDHSLELRTPLVDLHLWQSLAPLLATRTRPTKRPLALAPRESLPTSIMQRRKSGFGLPIGHWLSDNVEGQQQGRNTARMLANLTRQHWTKFG